jgi:hypothetical protein
MSLASDYENHIYKQGRSDRQEAVEVVLVEVVKYQNFT